jgi:parallel beta-helix repeat protein
MRRHALTFVTLVAVLALLVPGAAFGATYYVNQDGSEDFTDIQTALSMVAGGGLHTIIVRDGTYTGALNKDLDFLGKALTLQSENGPAACIIDCEGVGRGVNFYSGETSASVLDGFTIQNGVAPGTGYARRGGGIRCYSSSPTVINCVITGCSSGAYGGGLFCYAPMGTTPATPAFINCTFSDNSAANAGGGLWIYNSSPTITNCVVSGNSAGSGGGFHVYYLAYPVITNCTVTSNTATSGGGIDSVSYAGPVLKNSILWGNSATNGPEICVGGGPYGSGITVSYSDVEGGESALYLGNGCTSDPAGCAVSWGTGNIVVDPLFADAAYHLQLGSPAIDAGDPLDDYSNEPVPNGGRINMGAYGNTAEATVSGLPDDDCDGVDDDFDGVPDDDYVPTPTDCGVDLCYNEGALSCIGGEEVDTCVPLPPTTVYYDADSDGHGDPANALDVCTLPPDYLFVADDCDDGDPTINPDADDICGIDHIVINKDCDPTNDYELNCDEFCGDIDMDNYVTNEHWDNWGGVIPSDICPWIVNRGDCNDSDAAVNPVAEEVCDGQDNNCNGKIDEGCPAADQEEALETVKKMSSSDPVMQEAIELAKVALKKSLGNRHPEGDKKIIWLAADKLASKHGHKAYDYLKKAFVKIEKTASDPLLKAEADKALMYLEQSTKHLAEKSVADLPEGNDKVRAQEKYDKALVEPVRIKKLRYYRSTWKYANKGRREQPSCIEEITLLSPASDTVTAIGDEIDGRRTVLTDIEGNRVVIDTSCRRCLYVGQTIQGWTILEIVDDGTIAAQCSN